MKRLISLTLVLSSAIAIAATRADEAADELKSLQGTWKAVAMEARGIQLSKEAMPEFIFIVHPDGRATGKSPRGEYEARMTVDPSKDPKTIDNHHETGTFKGKTQYGVYKLEGDTWTVCMTAPGVEESARPRDFATKDTPNATFVFERQKEAE